MLCLFIFMLWSFMEIGKYKAFLKSIAYALFPNNAYSLQGSNKYLPEHFCVRLLLFMERKDNCCDVF